MKKIAFGLLTTLTVFAYSCSDNASNKQTAEQAPATQEETTEVKVMKASFTNVDAAVTGYIKKLTDNYLQIKNALIAGKATEAGEAARQLLEAMKGFDKSLLAADQKKVYDQYETGLKENAGHIAQGANDIEHQRERFADMSEGMYAIVKAFGGGKTLYHDHCPMAKNGKGAMWLSETKEIKNPYFGEKMMECGDVEEEIQN
ncbi:hypothetical protein A4H97_00410 [Niastella yeongjuensis]|uniref:DUF3347 domain-containing protein n=1 Tax=Niastella yeongjuensis TaxID=354355 RepID=A0A1V9EW38_9BACT|nr:DUF3347 domain-containing protein [Niastella yeongjuensis]OQP50341.1 hypothetical protein A4H97_00410 [Niastella yeongjuensis]SEN38637.1 Protein of unknown function [Niastella yeongjuensis]